MFALHTALYALLGTSLAFAIIELGLSAYVTSESEGTYNVGDGLGYKTVKVDPPAIYDFLLFSSVWTILITLVAFFLPRFFAQKARTISTDKAISGALIAIYFVTSVFWLAGFADLANDLDGYTGFDYLNAIIAFGVLLWLIFLALFILTILAVSGVLISDWPGYMSFKTETVPSEREPTTVEHGPEMETNPEGH